MLIYYKAQALLYNKDVCMQSDHVQENTQLQHICSKHMLISKGSHPELCSTNVHKTCSYAALGMPWQNVRSLM